MHRTSSFPTPCIPVSLKKVPITMFIFYIWISLQENLQSFITGIGLGNSTKKPFQSKNREKSGCSQNGMGRTRIIRNYIYKGTEHIEINIKQE